MPQKIDITSRLNYTCIQCGLCCTRKWYVGLTPEEIEKLKKLKWDNDHRPEYDSPSITFGGGLHLAHRENGSCIYFDPEKMNCRIHAKFGEAAKPIGCRVYPLTIHPTFENHLSASLRFDCPAVKEQQGPKLTKQQKEVVKTADLLKFPPYFDTDDLSQLSPKTVKLIVDGALKIAEKKEYAPEMRMLALSDFIKRLEGLGISFLNDEATMEEIMPSFIDRSLKNVVEKRFKKVKAFSAAAFRVWLSVLFRRDEVIVTLPFPTRLKRHAALWSILIGKGNFHALGMEHPDFPLAQMQLFDDRKNRDKETAEGLLETWDCYWKFLTSKLETMQFFGSAYYGAPFFKGLKGLLHTYPLVLGASLVHMNSEKRNNLTAEDVKYGVSAIDHGWGRLPAFAMHLLKSFEIFFSSAKYGKLLHSLGWH